MMNNPLGLKLSRAASLSVEDHQHLNAACQAPRIVDPRQDIIREGDRPDDVHVILDGFACRYKVLSEGSRQNMALLVPGDFCDLHVAILGEMDHSIGTLTTCVVVDIPRPLILELLHFSPQVTRALWWCTLVDEGTLREWLVGIGQRPAEQQMAHLFCELLVRLQTVGLADEHSYSFPLSQADVAETLGISTVHCNRVLQSLRAEGLVEWKQRRLVIPNPQRLEDFCGFTANYLHLDRRRALK